MVGNNRDTFGDVDVLIGTDRIIGTGQSDAMILDGSFTREAVGGGVQLVLISGATVADNSRLFGGDGDNSLFGANGADFLFGGAGFNIAFGSDGDDTYLSTGGNKTFHGEGGNDDVSFELIGAAVIVDLNFGYVFTTDTASVLSGTPRLILSPNRGRGRYWHGTCRPDHRHRWLQPAEGWRGQRHHHRRRRGGLARRLGRHRHAGLFGGHPGRADRPVDRHSQRG